MLETIVPRDREHWLSLRSKDVTSTEISALFGCSPYLTRFELWHRKKADTPIEIEENDRMKWGSRLQDAIARGLSLDNDWKVRPMPEYVRQVDRRIGASFDYAIGEDGILEVKNVDALQFRDGWIVDGDVVEAPVHIELQLQQQLMLTGRKFGVIGALVGGNRVVQIRREPDPAVHRAIEEKAREFWASIDQGVAPAPVFERDAEFISKVLYGSAVEGTVCNATDRIEFLMARYKDLAGASKDIEAQKDAIKAEILTMVGSAEKCVGEFGSLSLGMVAGGPVSYERKPYRNWKPYFKKEKK